MIRYPQYRQETFLNYCFILHFFRNHLVLEVLLKIPLFIIKNEIILPMPSINFLAIFYQRVDHLLRGCTHKLRGIYPDLKVDKRYFDFIR